ncbi:MAG TPA: ADP-ribosylglycohydrolase family protein [Caulifigura sp.]|nr:ADP-ribosylglycohydrolase family protein [Caulifigura sp.]
MAGCLLGTAIGDALGLAYEGLSRRRGARLLGLPDHYRLLGRRGFVSDDTEHTCLVAQSLIASGEDPDLFDVQMGRRLRAWFLTVPPGIGLATLKACLKLCIGIPPSRSGVHSAGNGPAMRAAIVGVAVKGRDRMLEIVRRSSRVTHTDVRAIDGAIAVALAARLSARRSLPVEDLASAFEQEALALVGTEMREALEEMLASVRGGQSTEEFADSIGGDWGVSGFVMQTVPVALHAWLRSPEDYLTAVQSVIVLGGDTDSTAAVVGGIIGSRVGPSGLPADLLRDLGDWPRSERWMIRLADQLETSAAPKRAVRLPVIPLLLRNVAFGGVLIAHAVRRWAPPY